jgi:murein DD-endopeptidase MepM/ murein hydrolase activator NlpD
MINCLTIFPTAILILLQIYLPIKSADRQDASQIKLTNIGQFGLIRKARINIPQHYHTGIDIKRPVNNYGSEPIFPIAEGIVISKRTDGAYANLIIEHVLEGRKMWSLYEHIAGIKVSVRDIVSPDIPIGRFMNKEELDRYGWQFDHFHFELLKVKPLKIQPTDKTPERFYNSYSLVCYSLKDLNRYYFDPIKFLNLSFNK